LWPQLPGGIVGIVSDVTAILSAIEQGDPHAASQLLPLVYGELRRLAAQKLAREKPGQTLDATALVHEAYLRLVGQDEQSRWDSRRHFFVAAAEAMRRILVEKAQAAASASFNRPAALASLSPDRVTRSYPDPRLASKACQRRRCCSQSNSAATR
jgi:RNA polymerase sigma factor (TIGR02999 family)